MDNHRILTAGLLVCLLAGSTLAGFESPAPPPPTPSKPAARPWDLSIRLFLAHNDNVQVVPDSTFFTGENEDTGAGLQVNGQYRLVDRSDWVVGATGKAAVLVHLENNAGGGGTTSDYDLTSAQPGVYVAHRGRLGAVPVTTTLSYDFRWEEGRDVAAIGLESHTLRLQGAFALRRELVLTAEYHHGWDDFDVTFPTPGLDDRDAERDGVSAGIKYWWDGRLRNVSATYDYLNNDAEGDNFGYRSHGVTLRFETHVIGPLWLAVDGAYRRGDYDGFVSGFILPPGRQEQDIYQIGVQGIWVLDEHWSLDAFWRYADYRSNQPQFEADVQVFGAGVTYRF